MPLLNFISDDDLNECVKHMISAAKEGREKADMEFERNTIDPFSTLFEIAFMDCNKDEWLRAEKRRQTQKSLVNAIGEFHQNVLGKINGWTDLKTSNQVDLVNYHKKVLAEVKNKHNTLKASDQVNLYKRLSELVSKKSSIFKDYVAYYVVIVPKNAKAYNVPFTPSDNSTGSKCVADDNIRRIDGRSFYAIATGEEYALDMMFAALPKVISSSTGHKLNASDLKFVSKFYSKAYGK